MTLAVISDLHLGPKRGEGPFTHSSQAACRALEVLISEHDELVVAGDLFDLDLSPRLWDKAEGLALARASWGDVLGMLDHPKVRRIHGNHDVYLEGEGVPDHLEYEGRAGRVGVFHGHQFRPGWRLREGIKAPVKWGANRLLGTPLHSLGSAMIALNERKEALEAEAGMMGRGALAFLKSRRDLGMLIYGHTHRPGVWETPHGTLANSGSWAYGRRDYLTLDLEVGEVTLHQVEVL